MKIGEIEAVIVYNMRTRPAERAAAELFKLGITEEILAQMKKTGTVVPEPWLVAVQNALRDLERK